MKYENPVIKKKVDLKKLKLKVAKAATCYGRQFATTSCGSFSEGQCTQYPI